MDIYLNEYRRYKYFLEKSLDQLNEKTFFYRESEFENSIAIILKHISGNLISRFTDFLTTDGEKSWRNRESEFAIQNETKNELLDYWQRAWSVLEESLLQIRKEDLQKCVTIRNIDLTVEEALLRSLAHFSCHVGQIMHLAKKYTNKEWQYLTIAPGQSSNYNKNPTKEKS